LGSNRRWVDGNRCAVSGLRQLALAHGVQSVALGGQALRIVRLLRSGEIRGPKS
jgi:hypothetical protein